MATRQQRTDDLERRVLGRRANECYGTCLHRAQERILLRLAEAMDLINEKYCTTAGEQWRVPCLFNDLTYLLDTSRHGIERIEGTVERIGYDAGNGCLASSRRPPHDEREDSAGVYHTTQYSPLANEVLLTDIIIERCGTQTFCQWLCHTVCYKNGAHKCAPSCCLHLFCLLAQANDLAVDEVDVVRLRILWQAWHTDDITGNGDDHLGTGIEHHVTDLQVEALYGTILLGIGTE